MLRVGVIGGSVSGGWATQSHIPALRAVDGVELVAVSTSRAESATASAEAFGARHPFASAESLASHPDVDLVTVAVKVPDHYAAVRAAIEAGKAVYCEWPLGINLAQALELRDLAAAAGVTTAIGLQARLTPAVQRLRHLVADGSIGRVLSARAYSAGFGLGGPELPADREWAADAANGLSVLAVRAAHTLDALEFCLGGIARLSAEVRVATPHPVIAGTGRTVVRTAPDQVLVTGTLDGGATFTGQFLLGVHPEATPLLTVWGTEATATLAADTPDGQVQMSALTLDGERIAAPPIGVEEGSAYGVAHLYAALRDGATVPDFDDAVHLHRLLESIELASSTGTRVTR